MPWRTALRPKKPFYDGYVVNCILDAAYRSAKSKQWEPVKLDIWRGKTGVSKDSHLCEFDADHYLVKEEVTHYGAKEADPEKQEDRKDQRADNRIIDFDNFLWE